jgi:hypothetical protein
MNTLRSMGKNLHKYLYILGIALIVAGSFQLALSEEWNSNPFLDPGSNLQIAGTIIAAFGFGIVQLKKLNSNDIISQSNSNLAENRIRAVYIWVYRWGALPAAILNAFLVTFVAAFFIRGLVHSTPSTGGFDIDFSGLAKAISLLFYIFLLIVGGVMNSILKLSRSPNFRRALIGVLIQVLIALAGSILGVSLYNKGDYYIYMGDDFNLLIPLGILVICNACAGLSTLPVLTNPAFWPKATTTTLTSQSPKE